MVFEINLKFIELLHLVELLLEFAHSLVVLLLLLSLKLF